jgi:hypothetical protein
MSDTSFAVSTEDANAALRIAAAIAKKNDLTFAVAPLPSADVERDSWNKSADFAMANDLLTESSMFLLGSTCGEHHAKGITIHLAGNFDALQADPKRKRSYLSDIRAKLAAAHDVQPNEVLILRLARGSVAPTYTLRSGIRRVEGIEESLRAQLGPVYIRHEIHPTFTHLGVNPDVFAVRWNRDFRVPSNCPVNESRGKCPYMPPAGWLRFGMQVLGKFEGGDAWLGHVNGPGEWAVVYHGTKHENVEKLTKKPLRAEAKNFSGHGIYCSPNPEVAEEDTDELELQGAKYKFMFMCRVNLREVHRCSEVDCSEDRNPRYTVHITQHKDIWFVNCQNESYQNIRAYGILVKQIGGR